MDPQASPNVLLKIEKNIPIPDKVGQCLFSQKP